MTLINPATVKKFTTSEPNPPPGSCITAMTNKWRSLNASANFRDGKFQNLSPTGIKAENVSFGKILADSLKRPATVKPPAPIPSVKTDLKTLYSETPTIVWFGHSSYLIHCKGINILVDPVFSGYASPIPGLVKAFPGANTYTPEDMPPIDLLILSHNHYDHFDTHSVKKLSATIGTACVPLGMGPAAAGCGIAPERIHELDWWENIKPMKDIALTAAPARHFSGRGLRRGGTLWSSFILDIKGHRIYLGGDSGYDTHFKTIGEKYGPFELAILECGQYNLDWPHIHMQPEETAQAALDLKAQALLPVHWAKFTLANHPWNEPIERVTKAAREKNLPIATPMIGQPVTVNGPYPQDPWWTTVV